MTNDPKKPGSPPGPPKPKPAAPGAKPASPGMKPPAPGVKSPQRPGAPVAKPPAAASGRPPVGGIKPAAPVKPGTPPKPAAGATTQPKVAATAPKAPPPAQKIESGPFKPDQVYYVESVGSEEDPTALLARTAAIVGDTLWWDDTNRERGFAVKDVQIEGEAITVKCERGFAYRFTPLTLEVYNHHVKTKVELSPSFGSTEELRHFYRTAPM